MFSNISFKCKSCDTNITKNIAIPDTNMDDNEGANDTQVIDCDVCRRTYEIQVINKGGMIETSISGVANEEISLSTPEIEADAEPLELYKDWRDDYEWYANISQKTVFEYFTVSVKNIRDMFTLRVNDKNQAEMLNRMLLVQCISALEAYLSDTLISRITSDHCLLKKLYSVDNILNNEKLHITAFLENDNLPLMRAKAYLEALMYHNIPKIQALYHSVLEVDFDYGNEQNKDLLFVAIEDRHDFVHRNGKTKQSGDLRLIDKKYISDVLTFIEEFVFRIEEELNNKDDIPF